LRVRKSAVCVSNKERREKHRCAAGNGTKREPDILKGKGKCVRPVGRKSWEEKKGTNSARPRGKTKKPQSG